jgi:hypothetical protein
MEVGRRRLSDAVYARGTLVREIMSTLPFPWRLRLIGIWRSSSPGQDVERHD